MQKNKPKRRRARTARKIELDDFDLGILRAVQQNNLRPLREIARAVNLSAPAVARRLQRLRADGAICADVSVLDPVSVGLPLTVIVEVTLHSELIEHLNEVRERFVKCSAIQQCYYVTGEVDFILVLALENMQQYESLTRELFFAGGNIKTFRTFVAMQRAKVSSELTLG